MDAERHAEKVFVALPATYEDGLSVLSWVLSYFPPDKTVVVITHVMMTSPFRGSDDPRPWLKEMNLVLNKYLSYCAAYKFKAEKLVHIADDIAEGIVQVIEKQGTKNLVMRSAANRLDLASETANKVMQEANQSCKLWFVSDGNLIFTREVNSEILTPAPASEKRSNEQSAEASSSTSARSNSESTAVEVNINVDSSLIEMLCEASEADNFKKMADKMAQLVPKLANKLQQKEQEVRELKEILEQKKRENDQLRREIEVVKHQRLQSEATEQVNQLRIDRDEYFNLIQVGNERKLVLERKIYDLEMDVKNLTAIAARKEDHIEALQAERDNFARKAIELSVQRENMHSVPSTPLSFDFSLQELQQATQNFSESLKIGGGGLGSVYKGSLRQTTVAIKLLHTRSLQGISQFQQEITILTKVRHPNLVTLIGASSEASALVYEYLSNGNLEECLTCANNTPPLTWQARTRNIGEICLALIFLHSNKPHLVVHGDLTPKNILLDSNFVSKLSDFGISRLLKQPDTNTTAFLQATRPAGTFLYVDPEYISTGILTPKSDIYSLGIIILRLLTGKNPLNIARLVEGALRDGVLLSVIDESAGSWPIEQASELAKIALRCAELSRSQRPDLVNEVWAVVEPLMKAAASYAEPQGHGSELGEESVPPHFVCPILQEVMQNPYIAADGFTYEAEAIRQWLRDHNTSPMTNLALPHRNLVPNHVLRSAIQEWLQQHPQC